MFIKTLEVSMIKNIIIICAGLFFASCSSFDLPVMGKKAGENFEFGER